VRRGVALAGAALALAGCGGGRLSHDTFVRRADRVCAAYDAKVGLLTRPASYDDVIAYVERTLPLHAGAVARLSELKPPQADARAVRAWLAAARRVETAMRALRAAALRRDPAATNDAADALQTASLSARQAAAKLGLHTCATP
jgi:hypothetical protein